MIHFLRPVALAAVALAAASAANAAVFQYQFKTYYDGSTSASTDTKLFSSVVAGLTISDIAGGAQISLKFKDTSLPDVSSSKKLTLDHLWLAGSNKGTLTKVSGDGGYYSFYSSGKTLPEGQKLNWDIDYSSAFNEGETSVLQIKGAGITAASLLTKAPQIEIDNVGGTFGKYTSKSLRFIGTVAPIPEPSTYALMGLGLVGVALAARRKAV
jgi:hypothetical protein